MSAASVLKKTFERIVGTIMGSSLAVLVGFVMTRLCSNDVYQQAVVMGSCIFIISFLVSFVVVQYPSSFGKYPYASLLVLLTFGIVGFPFYNNNNDNNSDDEEVWLKCIFRVVNIIIGCVLSAVMAFLVHPKPTYRAIQQSLEKQVVLATEASSEVLQSAVEVFSNQKPRIPLRTKILIDQNPDIDHQDNVLQLTKQGMGDFYNAKTLYPLLPYDAFYLSRTALTAQGGTPKEHRSLFESETQMGMYRAFRIHAIVQLINAIIHNDYLYDDKEGGHDFTQDHLELFQRVSHLIPIVLRDNDNLNENQIISTMQQPLLSQDPCALELCKILALIRQHAIVASDDLAKKRKNGIGMKASENPSEFLNDLKGFTMPPNPSATVLFLELVENLILRLLRLHATMQS